jgi:hypothetical protein
MLYTPFRTDDVRTRAYLTIVVATLLAAACNTGSSGTGLTPTIVTPPTKSETFTGTVAVGGSDAHAFVSSNYGEVSITLTAAGPPADIVMGVGIGAPTSVVDSTCRLYQNGYLTTAAGPAAQLVGNIPAGAYCVQVFDAGHQTAPVSYSVTVVHVQ